jgi:type VI secretion system protein ImpJ
MVLRGSPPLRKLVYDLAAQVEASRDGLVVQINQGGFNMELLRGLQLEQLLRLRTLNHFAARLPLLAEVETVTPFDIFMELHSLLGELGALSPMQDAFKVGRFNHEDPLPAFKELSTRIRGLLKGVVTASFMQIVFNKEEDYLALELTEEHLTKPNDYFLGIETNEEHRVVTTLVEDPDRFKLMPKAFVRRPIYGIKLKEERIPPPELPAKSNLKYYRVLRADSGRMWDMLKREKALALRWPGMEDSDFKVTLYMTVPL